MKLQKMPAGARAFSLPPKGPGNEVDLLEDTDSDSDEANDS